MTTLDTRPITEPGVVHDMPLDVYLADPVEGGSLSHSGAKTIVNKTPALFAYEREHGRPAKQAFDFGHAAHQIVLGMGPDIEVIPDEILASDGGASTKAAKQFICEARERGAVPIKSVDYRMIVEMAEAIRVHPLASKILQAGSGKPEVSAFARDPDTGVALRCRFDFLRPASSSGRLILVDYKSAVSADDESFSRAAVNYGYDLQDVFYSEIARLLGLGEDVQFLFIVQEKTAPYLVNVVGLAETARAIGRVKRRRAIATYKQCTESGVWPGYGTGINYVSLPYWHERDFEQEI